MSGLLPGGLYARLALVLACAVLAQFAAGTVLVEQSELLSADEADLDHTADALATAARVLDATAAPGRASAAQALSRPRFTVSWPGVFAGAGSGAAAAAAAPAFVAKLVAAAPSLAPRDVSVHAADSDGPYRGTARLADGSVFGFALPQPTDTVPAFWSTLASLAILSGFVLLAALVVARTLARPLRALAGAADAIGTGPAVPVAATGPRETRRLAQAFNAMQARIDRLISDRTQALAAVSHDLRTPISRMRLRCGLIPESDDRRALGDDLTEMEAMIASLSAYLRGEADPEAPRRVDVAAMLQTLVDDATDAGSAARYDGPERHVLTLRPLGVKRALANIVGNALTHGGRADVTLLPGAPTRILVEDDGPGVPEDQLALVFEPFHRVDAARTAGSGGMGLGLAIARQAIGRENGSVTLANRPGGGLRVDIALPCDTLRHGGATSSMRERGI